MTKVFKILPFLLLLCMAQKLEAQDKADSSKIPPAKSFVTFHQGVFGGKTIRYKATAKETYLKNDKGEAVASIWSVAYTQEGVTDQNKRPVTFVLYRQVRLYFRPIGAATRR